MFGRPFRIPSEMLYGGIDDCKFFSLKEFQENMRLMYDLVKKSMEGSQANTKKFYDKRRTDDDLDIGVFVYVYNPGMKDAKLKAKWHGPYMVTNKNETLYQIKIIKNDVIRFQWLPRDRLKRCYQPGLKSDIQTEEGKAQELQTTTVSEYSSSSDDDDVGDVDENVTVPNVVDNEMINARYNLRPRPTQEVDRFVVWQFRII